MAIRKQEFYEGAALHLLARTGRITSLSYNPPFFLLNNRLIALLKFSTKGRSPWGFTFGPEEQSLLDGESAHSEVVIGLICGSDGVAALKYPEYRSLVSPQTSMPIHLSCYRQHREHYQVRGPLGVMSAKVPPAEWSRVLHP